MDWYWWAVIAFAIFAFGFYVGVAALHSAWLRPGIEKGILEVGGETYRLSRIVKRNTRI